MPEYRYPFTIDDKSLLKLKGLTGHGWMKVITMVLYNKPVDLNINFSKLDPKTRLCELYNLILTYKVDPSNYQKALISVMEEYYGKNTNYNEIFCMIQVLDHVKPVMFFERLRNLIVSPKHFRMLEMEFEGKISPHYYLINVAMKFDHEQSLYLYLMNLNRRVNTPEYIQICVRYVYTHNKQIEFNECMNMLFHHFSDPEKMRMAVQTIDEYVFYRKDCKLIFYWLFYNRKILIEISRDVYKTFLEQLELKFTRNENPGFNYFEQLTAFLNSIFEKKIQPQLFNKLVRYDFEGKRMFFFFLGRRNAYIKYGRSEDGRFIFNFGNKELLEYDLSFSQELNAFCDGLVHTTNAILVSQLQPIAL